MKITNKYFSVPNYRKSIATGHFLWELKLNEGKHYQIPTAFYITINQNSVTLLTKGTFDVGFFETSNGYHAVFVIKYVNGNMGKLNFTNYYHKIIDKYIVTLNKIIESPFLVDYQENHNLKSYDHLKKSHDNWNKYDLKSYFDSYFYYLNGFKVEINWHNLRTYVEARYHLIKTLEAYAGTSKYYNKDYMLSLKKIQNSLEKIYE